MSVPVTVKLSELFYQKFGHEVVDEMVNWFNQVDDTYRGQLRELNELNFARFDAKLEQRLAEAKAELRQEMAGLRTKLADLQASLIKWMFIFWIGQAGLTVGLVLLVGRR
jgi:ABC-type phosphate transport system auxiliary subunit